MRLSTPLATAAALVLFAAPGCAPVRAEPSWGPPPDEGYASEEPYEPEEAPDPEYYRDELDAYGEWHDDPRYGAVWHPTYAPGWRPYADGYWAWTAYGWTWVSYEPWAWTLHYGRWVVLPVGWVWVPGTVWGPAWVDWYWGSGYVGWAPLSPFGHVTVINNFVFVNERDFCSREVRHHFVHHRRINGRHWRARDHRPPRHDRIQRVSRHTVTRLDGRPRQTLAPRRDRDRRMARPDTRPDLTGARRGRSERQELRRERRESERTARPASGRSRDGRPDREPRVREPGFRIDADGAREDRARPDRQPRVRQPRVVREPGFGFDDDDARVERRRPSPGSSGRPRFDSRPGREPRVRRRRFDADDRPQFQRGHAWAGRGGGGGRRSEDGPRGEGRGVQGGSSMGFAPGAR